MGITRAAARVAGYGEAGARMWRELEWRLANAVTWSPPAWQRPTARAAFEAELGPDARQRWAALGAPDWSACCDRVAWGESAYVLDLLRQHVEGRGLDVGSKTAAYLTGLATFAPIGWDCVEVHAHRRYLWGSTRRVYGERMAAAFPGCRYHAADMRTVDGRWELVTWFLPFLTEAPLRAWGLPPSLLAPDALLAHVTARVAPGGTLLVVNQGEGEAELQAQAFARLGLRPDALGRVDAPLSPFRRERYGFRWTAPRTTGARPP